MSKKFMFFLLMMVFTITCVFADVFLIESAFETRFSDTVDADLFFLDNRDAIISYREIELNNAFMRYDILRSKDNIILNLFDNREWNAKIDRISVNVNNTLAIRGSLSNYDFAYFIISTTDSRSYAIFDIPEKGQYYIITSSPETHAHYLMEMDRSRMDIMESHPVLIPDTHEMLENKVTKACKDDAKSADIDVMVVYTPAANTWANNNASGINNVISMSMQIAQLVCDNSNTLMNMNLVHSAEVSYTESGNSLTDLQRLTYTNDGHMDEVHTWRDMYGADLVALFSLTDDTGGLGWILNTTAGAPQWAFSLTRVQQAANTYTHMHEMGHNMGTHHHKNQNVQPGPGLYSYSAGWRWTGAGGGKYSSIMTYEGGQYFADGVTHYNVPHFSNPNILFDGVATGHSLHGDNARGLRNIRNVIANYRTSTIPSAPSNLQAVAVSSSRIDLSWTDNSHNEIGFKIERKEGTGGTWSQIAVVGANIENYIDTGLSANTAYYYRVRAYSSAGDSAYSNQAEATTLDYQTSHPSPVNLSTFITDENHVLLQWGAPEISTWIFWGPGEFNGGSIGTDSAAVFDVAHKFTGPELMALGVDGRYITQISFVPAEANCVYKVRVWLGGTGAPAQLVLDQPVINPVISDWNIIDLDSPVYIDGTQTLWLGYNVDTQQGLPAGCDDGPAVNHSGNMINWGGWTTLLALGPHLDYNWCIKGLAAHSPSKNDGGTIIDRSAISEKYKTNVISDKMAINRLPSFADHDGDLNRGNKSQLLGYNVYRDGIKINTAIITDLSYLDTAPLIGVNQSYHVTALYDTGESGPSNTENVFIDPEDDYFLTLDIDPYKGSATVNGLPYFAPVSIQAGSEVILTVTENTGWNFEHWIDADSIIWTSPFFMPEEDLELTAVFYQDPSDPVSAIISLEHTSVSGIWKWTYNPNKSVYLDTGPAIPENINADKSQWTWQRLIQYLKAQKLMAADISGDGLLEVIIHFDDNVLGYYSFVTGTWNVIMNDVFDFTVARTAQDMPKQVVFTIAEGVYVLNYGVGLDRIYTATAEILHAADLFRDGLDELLIGFETLPNLYVYSFASASHSVLARVKPSQMVSGDITGDGYNELVCAFEGFGIYLFRNIAEKGQLSHKVFDNDAIFNIINDVPENHKWVSGNKGWQIQRITYADPMPGHQMATGNIAEGNADELVLSMIGRTYYYSYIAKGWTILTFAPMKTIIAGRFTGGEKDDLITCMGLNNNIFLRPSAVGAWQLMVTAGNSNAMAPLE